MSWLTGPTDCGDFSHCFSSPKLAQSPQWEGQACSCSLRPLLCRKFPCHLQLVISLFLVWCVSLIPLVHRLARTLGLSMIPMCFTPARIHIQILLIRPLLFFFFFCHVPSPYYCFDHIRTKLKVELRWGQPSAAIFIILLLAQCVLHLHFLAVLGTLPHPHPLK